MKVGRIGSDEVYYVGRVSPGKQHQDSDNEDENNEHDLVKHLKRLRQIALVSDWHVFVGAGELPLITLPAPVFLSGLCCGFGIRIRRGFGHLIFHPLHDGVGNLRLFATLVDLDVAVPGAGWLFGVEVPGHLVNELKPGVVVVKCEQILQPGEDRVDELPGTGQADAVLIEG